MSKMFADKKRKKKRKGEKKPISDVNTRNTILCINHQRVSLQQVQ